MTTTVSSWEHNIKDKGKVMRAETEEVVAAIKQSIALLRRSL